MNRPRHLTFAALTAVAVLGCSDTASAQPQLTLNPPATQSNPLVFNNVASGGVSPSQTITVGTSNGGSGTVIVQISPSSPWLVVTPGASVNIPATLSVHCNTSNLTTGGYNGSFTLTVDGSSNPPVFVTVYVTLNVTGVSQLTATPQSLNFSAQAGASAASPNGTQVQIFSSGMPLNYNLQASTGNGANWLLLSTLSGSTAGVPFTVSVNPSGLTAVSFPAIFNGSITATSTTTADAVVIPVQVTLTANAQVSVTPTSLPPFLYQSGSGTDPAAQPLSISAVNGPLAFSLQVTPAVSWLIPSARGGTAQTTPDVITLAATPAEQGLTPGTYTTSIVVTPSGEPALPAIPISLVVAAHPLIQVSTNSLSFTAAFAGSNPAAQSVILTNPAGANVGFTVTTSASWLIAGPSTGATPATLTVQVNAAGLTQQTYNGTVTITPSNGDQYTQTIAVTLNVSGASQLVAGPSSLLFSYETGQLLPPSQTIEIQTTSLPLTFTVAVTTNSCGSSWLQAQPSSPFVNLNSNTTLGVSVVTTGLSPGTCSGTVSLNYFNGLANTSLAIPVTLAVSSSPELSVNLMPGFGLATASQIGASFQQQITLTSTDPATQVSYIASLTNVGGGGGWLTIASSSTGTTPQNLYIQYNPEAVSTPGTYTGTVNISSSSLGAAMLSIPVSLTVASTTSVAIVPTSLSFTQNVGGSPPAAQTLTLSSGPGLASYTAIVASSTGGSWLQISPTSGNTNGPVTVTVLPLAGTLPQGSYAAQIAFGFQGAETTSATVNVTLNVTAPQAVTALPTSLTFNYQVGGTVPSSQPLMISAGSGTVSIGVSATSSGWLSVSPTAGTAGSTPQTITVSVNPQGLTAQTYNGSISVTAPGVLAAPLSIPVSLNVISAPPPQVVVILSNASDNGGAIAPGEELAIKGTYLGPATPASGLYYTVNSAGAVSNTLAGVQVMFDNNPGTPIFVSAGEIFVMVPYEINGRSSTTMVVLYNGVPSASFPLSVVPAAPGLYTTNFSGTGQVAAINQNNSFNGAGAGFQAAPRGTVIALYGSGGGQSTPASVTGSITPIPTNAAGLLTIPNVKATVGGIPATVQFAGEAPGEVTGVFQINVLIPGGVTPGNAVPVTVFFGSVPSQTGTTIAVN